MSAFQNNRNLCFLCVLSICEVCFYQRFKASVSLLTQVEHKDKEKHQETDEDSPQSGAQHKHIRPSCHIELNGVGVSQLLRCNVYLLVGDRREEGNHVVVPVVTNGGHLIWEGGIGWSEPFHPLIKNGVSESVEHQKDGVVGCRVRQSTGAVEQGVDEVVEVIDGFIQLSIWFFIPFKSISKTKGGVGEVWWAVEVSDPETAPDIIHGGQRHVSSPHYPSLNGPLVGAVTESHQTIVVIQAITDHPPSGEPGLVTDEEWVVWVSPPEQRVGTHITLALPCGKVPVRDREILIAGQSL